MGREIKSRLGLGWYLKKAHRGKTMIRTKSGRKKTTFANARKTI
jgi:hypothetical protein